MNETPANVRISTFPKFVSCRVNVAKSIDLIVIIIIVIIIYNSNNNNNNNNNNNDNNNN